MSSAEPTAPAGRRAFAWGVHALTASGAVVALLTLLAVAERSWPTAGLWMLVALAIDSVDGSLARRARVAEVVPEIDGRRLDDIVDYLNYVLVPAVFLVWLGALPHWSVAAAPLLASAYGFSQADAKTDDHFFLGFPSYWNVVALYVWLLEMSPTTATLWVVGLSIAVFVPLKYLYPSHMTVLRRTANLGALAWILLVASLIALPELPGRGPLIWLSLAYPAFYLAASLWLGGMRR